MRHLVALQLLWILLPVSARAIVIRHDRDDAAYRALAEGYDEVCRVGGGAGTLIDPRWVLTAGHVADALPRSQATVRFEDREVPVTAIHLHPQYLVEDHHRDLALLELAEPVEDIAPARLNRQDDELGQQVVFVGDGRSGTGKSGPVDGERILRAAHNTVDSVTPGWLTFTFDAPPAGDDLEGISGPGDSGGPALLSRDGAWTIVGVSAYNDGGDPCTYGTTEYYCRVFDELDWIDAVMSGATVTEPRPRVVRYGQTEDGRATAERVEPTVVSIPAVDDGPLWSVVESLQAALREQSVDDYLTLFSSRCLQRESKDMLVSMLEFMGGVQAQRGPIVGYHPLAAEGMQIEESKFPMRPVVFHFEDGMPGYFGLAVDRTGHIDHFSLFVQESICSEGTHCTQMQPLQARR